MSEYRNYVFVAKSLGWECSIVLVAGQTSVVVTSKAEMILRNERIVMCYSDVENSNFGLIGVKFCHFGALVAHLDSGTRGMCFGESSLAETSSMICKSSPVGSYGKISVHRNLLRHSFGAVLGPGSLLFRTLRAAVASQVSRRSKETYGMAQDAPKTNWRS